MIHLLIAISSKYAVCFFASTLSPPPPRPPSDPHLPSARRLPSARSQTRRALPAEVTSGQWADVATFCCGLVSGLCASVVTQPADVVKTRVQLTTLAAGGSGSLSHAIGMIYQVSGAEGGR